MLTVLLLLVSNAFMAFAWYGHLLHKSAPLGQAVVVSWLIAFGEYCFQVPANRIGYDCFSGCQLQLIQGVHRGSGVCGVRGFLLVASRSMGAIGAVRAHSGCRGVRVLGKASNFSD